MRLKKQKWMKDPVFKPGDLVTGIDQSYRRSIYRYIGPSPCGTKGKGLYEIESYDGRDNAKIIEKALAAGHTQEQIWSITRHTRMNGEFRLARWIEVKMSSTKSHQRLIELLWALGIRPEYELEDK